MTFFDGRPYFIRMAAIAVAGAGCLAATACAGTAASSLSAVPSASSTSDPLASLTASKVAAEATANAEDAPSVTMNGTVSQSGKSYTIDLGIKRGQGCTGNIGLGGEGSLKLIVIGKTVYINPDNQFWKSQSGSEASTVIALVGGRYLKVSASDKNMTGLAAMCNVSRLLNSDTTPVTYTKEAVTTLDGTRVLPLKVSDGSTEYVTDTSKPEFVEASAPKGSKVGAGKIIVSVGSPVTLTAPPASQVINGSALGM